jgi:hypothetical protein
MIERILTKTCLTSRATVAGEGSRYMGRPVFIMSTNPRSLTIENGRLFSATQRTISTLSFVSVVCPHVSNSPLSSFPCMCTDDVNKSPFLCRSVRRPMLYSHFAAPRSWRGPRVRLPDPLYHQPHSPLHHPSTSSRADEDHWLTSRHQCPGSVAHHDHFAPCSWLLHTRRREHGAHQCIQYEARD